MISVVFFGNIENVDSFPMNQNVYLGFWEILPIVLISILSGLLVQFLYTKYSLALSSKSSYGNTLLMITFCVSALIAVVKSSLALSLGLVGALSVIRYRTAVKEPYTLAFILLAVSLGISTGASQFLFTFWIAISAIVITFFSYTRNKKGGLKINKINHIDSLIITASNEEAIINSLAKLDTYSSTYGIKNLNNTSNSQCVANLAIQIDSNELLIKLLKELNNDKDILNVTFYDNPLN